MMRFPGKKTIRRVCSLAILLSAPTISRADGHADEQEALHQLDEMNLDKLYDVIVDYTPDLEVQTPAKLRQRSSRAPASIHVISKEDISAFGYRNLGDVLRHVAGFNSPGSLC